MDGVNSFEDLNAWKLASELSAEVYRMTESGRVTEDFKFRNQIRDSAASAPRNISEGWGRYYPNENAPYVRIAKGSLNETKNHLLHGKRVRYFRPEDFNKAFRLVKRALGATTRYLLYLESCGKDVPGQPPRTKTRSRPTRPADSGENKRSASEAGNEPERGTGNPEPRAPASKEPEHGTRNPEPPRVSARPSEASDGASPRGASEAS